MMEYKPRDYSKEFEQGSVDLGDLYAVGFRRTSKKYRTISYSWKAHKKKYHCDIVLSPDDFELFENSVLKTQCIKQMLQMRGVK